MFLKSDCNQQEKESTLGFKENIHGCSKRAHMEINSNLHRKLVCASLNSLFAKCSCMVKNNEERVYTVFSKPNKRQCSRLSLIRILLSSVYNSFMSV